jgi:hypothetical protein
MSLREKQSLFVGLVALLIIHAKELGYQLTFGEALRSPEEAIRLAKAGKGIQNSVHCLSLAIDLNLFKNGVYLSSTEDHRVLGEYWKTLDPLARWGGDFKDGNHYSLEHNGVK